MPVSTKGLAKPTITRLARQGGVKSMADGCTDLVRDAAVCMVDQIVSKALIYNKTGSMKTLSVDEICLALKFLGYNVTNSSDIGTTTFAK